MFNKTLILVSASTIALSVRADSLLFPGTISQKEPHLCIALEPAEVASDRFFAGEMGEKEYLEQVLIIPNKGKGYVCSEAEVRTDYINYQSILVNQYQCPSLKENNTDCKNLVESMNCLDKDSFPSLYQASASEPPGYLEYSSYIDKSTKETHWVVYTQEWIQSSVKQDPKALPFSQKYLVNCGFLDGYFKRKSQQKRVYARHYFVRAGKSLCTLYHQVNTVTYHQQEGLVITDYEWSPETERFSSIDSLTAQPGTDRTWLRCMTAGTEGGDSVQIETRLSKFAYTRHYQVTDPELIAREFAGSR